MARISYQLHSSRNFNDLPMQAAMLAGLGFRDVEPFGGQLANAGRLRGILDEHGLAAPTVHVGAPAWRTAFDRMAGTLKVLEPDVAIVPAVPAEQQAGDREHWKALGRELSEYARRIGDHGFRFGWHNHGYEFATLEDGSRPLDWLLGDDPLVLLQLDIAWAARGGADPVALMRRYGERIVSFHVKDLAGPGGDPRECGWADVGHGTLDWAALVPAMRATAAEYWVLEHDDPLDDRRFATRAMAAVSGW